MGGCIAIKISSKTGVWLPAGFRHLFSTPLPTTRNTFSETNIFPPENWCLEDFLRLPFRHTSGHMLTVSSREGSWPFIQVMVKRGGFWGLVVWIPGIPENERDCYLGVPLDSNPKPPKKPFADSSPADPPSFLALLFPFVVGSGSNTSDWRRTERLVACYVLCFGGRTPHPFFVKDANKNRWRFVGKDRVAKCVTTLMTTIFFVGQTERLKQFSNLHFWTWKVRVFQKTPQNCSVSNRNVSFWTSYHRPRICHVYKLLCCGLLPERLVQLVTGEFLLNQKPAQQKLVGGFNYLLFSPLLWGRLPIWLVILQVGWNQQAYVFQPSGRVHFVSKFCRGLGQDSCWLTPPLAGHIV